MMQQEEPEIALLLAAGVLAVNGLEPVEVVLVDLALGDRGPAGVAHRVDREHPESEIAGRHPARRARTSSMFERVAEDGFEVRDLPADRKIPAGVSIVVAGDHEQSVVILESQAHGRRRVRAGNRPVQELPGRFQRADLSIGRDVSRRDDVVGRLGPPVSVEGDEELGVMVARQTALR